MSGGGGHVMSGGGQMLGGRGGFSRSPGFSTGARFGALSGFAGHNSVFVGTRFGHFGGSFHNHFIPGRFRNQFLFSFGVGFPFAYPYYYGSYYYPPYPSYYTPGYSYPPAYYEDASEQRRQLEYEVERLNDKLERMSQDRAEADRTNPDRQNSLSDQATRPRNKKDNWGKGRPVVLVFRDKHIQEANDYAIVGNTIWLFSEDRAKKISLHDLDLVATTRLNEERGVDFVVPPPPRKAK